MNRFFRPMRAARNWVPYWASLAVALILTGCAGYQKQMGTTVDAVRAGAADAALADLEAKNAGSGEKDLLYYLEKGELLRMKNAFQPSLDTWNVADEKVRAWEEQAKLDPSKLLGNIGSVVLNDTTRRYDGRDYEKVLLSVRLALNQLALGNWEGARIEIKKMHEREAVIADFRAKDLEDAKASAESKGLKATSFKELNGYPVETLEAPEILALKNAYESAIANYLAGFIYEASGDPSLAAAGYRKAIELRPNQPFLESALAELDGRAQQGVWLKDPAIPAYEEAVKAATDPKTGKLKKGIKLPPVPLRKPAVDTLILVESGLAPAISSRMIPIPLPIPSKGGLQVVMTPISWPVLEPVSALDQVTGLFGIVPDHDLDIMRSGQDLNGITATILQGLKPVLEAEAPDMVLVHGDTATTLATTLAAYYARIPVGHVESLFALARRGQPPPGRRHCRAAFRADGTVAPAPSGRGRGR